MISWEVPSLGLEGIPFGMDVLHGWSGSMECTFKFHAMVPGP